VDTQPIVATTGLTKRFGSLVAVDGVDLELRPGVITAVIGPNGAGKSTLIGMLSGLLLPSEGEIRLAGQPIQGLHCHDIAAMGVARTFQTPRLFPGLTAVENVMLARYGRGRQRWLGGILRSPLARREEQVARDTALSWLDLLGLAGVADHEATSLPIGTQRLLELVRALATEPAVLLLDEPAAGLDPSETAELGDVFRREAAAGPAVLLVEHDMSMVMSIADVVVVLDRGRRIAAGTPSEVSRDPEVIRSYLGTSE
jgi:ABC-type branched-subunit amino acid transport system ATPase component